MNKLQEILKGLLLVVLMGSLVTFTSCDEDNDDDEPVATMTLSELMAADANLSRLKGWMESDAELKAILEGTATHTLFAPNNAAFAKLEETLGSSLDIVAPQIVGAVLRFQLTAGNVVSADVAGGSFVSLQGESIVGNADGTIATGGSDTNVETITPDLAATNGTMHVIETIMIPPTLFASIGLNLGKISQAILLGKDFTILASGIAKADEFAAGASQPTITSIITSDFTSTKVKYTFFAPSNGTFEAGSITAATYTGQQWYGIIMNHIVAGEANVEASELTTCAAFNTLIGGELVFFNNTDVVPAANGIGVYIDSDGNVDCTLEDKGASLGGLNAEVAIAAASTGSNGVIHVIAGVLAPAQ